MAPKTVEEAKSLREVPGLDFYYLGGGGISGDSICSFVDTDGLAKTIECIRRTPDGADEWVKVTL